MRNAVSAHSTRAVYQQAYRQLIQRHVVYHLIERALQERRVQAHIRPRARRQRHRVFLGYAHVKHAPRIAHADHVHARARRHGCGYAYRARIAFHHGVQLGGHFVAV